MKVKLSEVYVDEEIKRSVLDVLDSGWFIMGQRLERFEEEFAKFTGTRYAIGVSSGTAAIHVALLALGVKRGDKIIVPSLTAFPTVEPILNIGAIPLFAEVDPITKTIDPVRLTKDDLNEAKGIVAVHLYGHPADLSPLKEMAESQGLFLLEDCAQAHGALYKQSRVGSIGTIGCFSFYPSKNMTVCGDGGMIVCDDANLAERSRLLRNHGVALEDRYRHVLVGYNYRMSEISAAIGLIQLRKLEWFNSMRIKWARLYSEYLSSTPVTVPHQMEWARHVFHLYVIEGKEREKLMGFLQERGIVTGIHYPVPCHLQPAIPDELRRKLPVTEGLVGKILSLPMYPRLSEEQVNYVAEAINGFYRVVA